MNSQDFSIERVVTLFAPFFAALASAVTGWISQHIGLKLDPTALAVIMSAAFLGAIAVVVKWLTGRQIPEIAGLKISQQQLTQLHTEIAAYLAAHAEQLSTAEAEITTVIEHYLDANLPGKLAALKPDPDQIATEVLDRFRKSLSATAPAAASAA